MEHIDDVLLLNHFAHAADGTEGAAASPTVPGGRGKEARGEGRQGWGDEESPAYAAAHAPVSLQHWLGAFGGLGKQR